MDIVIKNICKAYDDKKVLDNFSCIIKENCVTAIMGKSGCGKTTLASIIMGTESFDSGSITGLDGKKLSVVFQEDRLCENLSAVSNARLVCNTKVSRKEIVQTLKEIGLADSLNQPVRELSGGMKRRVAIVRALVADYDVIIFDEPFKGLDEKTKAIVIEFVKAKIKGKTMILITHERNDAQIFKAEIIEM